MFGSVGVTLLSHYHHFCTTNPLELSVLANARGPLGFMPRLQAEVTTLAAVVGLKSPIVQVDLMTISQQHDF